MPIVGSWGESTNTPLKQEHLTKLMHAMFPAIRSIMKRHDWALKDWASYIDLTSGPGYYPDTKLYGSPLIAIQEADHAALDLNAWLFEKDHTTHELLIKHIKEMTKVDRHESLDDGQFLRIIPKSDSDITVLSVNQSYEIGLPRLLHIERQQQGIYPNKKQRFGMLYLDENGKVPPIGYLQAVAMIIPRMDIVLHLATTNIKRRLHSPLDPWPYGLIQIIAMIGKSYWVIREPFDRHNWSFLVGTNWDSFPVLKAQGFHRTNLPDGQELLTYLDQLRREGQHE